MELKLRSLECEMEALQMEREQLRLKMAALDGEWKDLDMQMDVDCAYSSSHPRVSILEAQLQKSGCI